MRAKIWSSAWLWKRTPRSQSTDGTPRRLPAHPCRSTCLCNTTTGKSWRSLTHNRSSITRGRGEFRSKAWVTVVPLDRKHWAILLLEGRTGCGINRNCLNWNHRISNFRSPFFIPFFRYHARLQLKRMNAQEQGQYTFYAKSDLANASITFHVKMYRKWHSKPLTCVFVQKSSVLRQPLPICLPIYSWMQRDVI